MKKISLLLLLVTTLSIALTGLNACKKTDPKPEEKTKTDLISRNWKVKQVDNVTGGSSTVLYQEGAASNAENYAAYRLNFTSATNFSRTEKDGTTTVTGTWQFDSSETRVTFSTGKPTEVTIVELREGELIISFTETSSKNVTRELRMQLIPA